VGHQPHGQHVGTEKTKEQLFRLVLEQTAHHTPKQYINVVCGHDAMVGRIGREQLILVVLELGPAMTQIVIQG
jgi:hypothetical protein